nr:hypothetical protein [Tanacetum cinerariifolium]
MDEGLDSEGEEVAPEGQQRQATLVKVTTADRSLRLGYEATRHHALELAEEIAPSTFEIGQSSRSVPDQQVANEIPTPRIPARTTWIDPQDASPVTTPTATIAIDEDEFLERVIVGIPQSCLIGRGRLERKFTLSVSGMEAWNKLRSRPLSLLVPYGDQC